MTGEHTFPVQPVLAVLFSDAKLLPDVRHRLEQTWGPVGFQSDPVPFDITDYYEEEMGPELKRSIWGFEREMDASELVERKKRAREVEEQFARAGDRQVNLDPGYLDPAKLVLASEKENGQKIYLRDGVFADIILFYEKGDWEPMPWTFPDFSSGRYDEALTRIRTDWKRRRS
jgi:hypothetical protein